jgi:hypothetical protein
MNTKAGQALEVETMSGPLGKELTKFLKLQLKEKLEPNLVDLGFFKPVIEKPFLGVSFDAYSYR